jgi:hypothetical protein
VARVAEGPDDERHVSGRGGSMRRRWRHANAM